MRDRARLGELGVQASADVTSTSQLNHVYQERKPALGMPAAQARPLLYVSLHWVDVGVLAERLSQLESGWQRCAPPTSPPIVIALSCAILARAFFSSMPEIKYRTPSSGQKNAYPRL